jgi:allophanate hydrolase subunit 2
VLALGGPGGPPPAIDMAPYPLPGDRAELRIHAGPRRDWLSASGVATLTGATWTVSPDSNRIALRLQGAPVERARRDELASEGIVLGAVQSLPDGGLVVFLADHPTTGGYPVVAVVDPGCLGACAQARPGSAVTLRWARGSG